jgi:hypothetical protein
MIDPTSAIADGSIHGDEWPTMVSTISSAPPESAKEFGEHRAQCDQDAYPGRGGPEPIGERCEDVPDVHSRNDAHGQAADDQGQEWMVVIARR